MKLNNGFSLIELMIVVAFIAIMSAITAPLFSKTVQNSSLRSAVSDLVTDIQQCKQRAVAENVRYQIVFDQGANSYTVNREQGGAFVAQKNKSLGSFGSGTMIASDVTPSFGAGVPAIMFVPRGTIDAGSLTLVNSRGSRAVISTFLMGRVSVTNTWQ